ncbi:hypothetical protein GCM10028819_09790 [Spirosoma humi]
MFSPKILLAVCTVTILLASCKTEEEAVPTPEQPPANSTGRALGWASSEDISEVPVATTFGLLAANSLPTSIDLSAYLPPIGNQGSYGTCVAWAAGYYTKTTIEGISKGYSASQLSNPQYQISPRDLFTSLPDNQKGSNCGGTSFMAALDMMQQRGVATLSTAPYTDLGDCRKSSASAGWETDAAKHKIKTYRTIEASVFSIKQQLASKIPVLLGAILSDNFMTWNSDNVLSSNTTYKQVGQHAGHALTIVGYDDTKGPGGAFKVVNSWGASWGSRGFIWIDYNFLVNTFAGDAGNGEKFLMVMSESAEKPTDDPTPQPGTGGVNLVAWVNEDYSMYSQTGAAVDRTLNFNIYNDGSKEANPGTPWTAYYIYYNARNANDYGVLFQHTYTTRNLPANQTNCMNGNCELNVSIPAKDDLSNVLFGNSEEGAEINYRMPATLNGSYYLVLIVDGDNTFDEGDEEDNYFYTTERPIKFRNGYAARQGYVGQDQAKGAFSFKNLLTIKSSDKLRRPFNSAINAEHQNAYSTQEISHFIRQQKKSGAFAQKVQEYQRQKTTSSIHAAQ